MAAAAAAWVLAHSCSASRCAPRRIVEHNGVGASPANVRGLLLRRRGCCLGRGGGVPAHRNSGSPSADAGPAGRPPRPRGPRGDARSAAARAPLPASATRSGASAGSRPACPWRDGRHRPATNALVGPHTALQVVRRLPSWDQARTNVVVSQRVSFGTHPHSPRCPASSSVRGLPPLLRGRARIASACPGSSRRCCPRPACRVRC